MSRGKQTAKRVILMSTHYEREVKRLCPPGAYDIMRDACITMLMKNGVPFDVAREAWQLRCKEEIEAVKKGERVIPFVGWKDIGRNPPLPPRTDLQEPN